MGLAFLCRVFTRHYRREPYLGVRFNRTAWYGNGERRNPMNRNWIASGLLTLALQDFLLLLAGWSRLAPHPPEQVMPFIGALAAASLRLALGASAGGRATAAGAAVVAVLHLANFGPHKFLAPHPAAIAPMVAVGLWMIVQVLLGAAAAWRANVQPAREGAAA